MATINQDLISVDKFLEYARSFDYCHASDLAPVYEAASRMKDVLAVYIEDAETYEDTKSVIVVQLGDDEVGIFEEWSDSSGHG